MTRLNLISQRLQNEMAMALLIHYSRRRMASPLAQSSTPPPKKKAKLTDIALNESLETSSGSDIGSVNRPSISEDDRGKQKAVFSRKIIEKISLGQN